MGQQIRTATLGVGQLNTTDKWTDGFTVAVYSDAACTTLIGAKTVKARWDLNQYSWQQELVMFPGLVFGQTYWVKASVNSPDGRNNWTTPISIVAGQHVVPACTYNGSVNGTPSGISYNISCWNVPSDIDHFEAIWTKDDTIPSPSAEPYWTGHANAANLITFFAGGSPPETIYAFVRAVNTKHVAQPWYALPPEVVKTVNYWQTLDDIPDGGNYGKILNVALKGGKVNTFTGVIPLGNINPAWTGNLYVGVQQYGPGFRTYIRWYWDQLTVYRPDGSYTVVGAVPHDHTPWLCTNLDEGTTYYYYPYIDETTSTISFVAGGDVNDGNPHITHSSLVDWAAAIQGWNSHMALNNGGLNIVTPEWNGDVSEHVGGGGGSRCPRHDMLVETLERGLVEVGSVVAGEHVRTSEEIAGKKWLRVLANRPVWQNEWLRLRCKNDYIEQTPETPMVLADGEGEKRSFELSAQDMLIVADGVSRLYGFDYLEEGDWAAHIACEAPHLFLCGARGASILTHNTVLGK